VFCFAARRRAHTNASARPSPNKITPQTHPILHPTKHTHPTPTTNNNNKKFYVADGELSCQLYQRSADVGLGVPFNIASYALLTLMLAQVAGLAAGELVHVLGDAHVYANHVEPLSSQLANAPRHLPTLRINAAKTEIDAFEPSDFELDGYRPHKKIAMTMAV
jgi:dihydrofolate reductase/thymidylate synthase